MESSILSYSDHLSLYLLRPILAFSFVFFLLFLGWFLAWKLVLVHVPLVQEIFGLRKKTVFPKPPSRGRYSKFYNSLNSRNPESLWDGETILHDEWPVYRRCATGDKILEARWC